MGPFLQVHVNASGVALATLCVVLGAPMFAAGLRAIRLRRAFRALRETPLDDTTTGLTQTSGRVTLESPLFSPLSGRPCAGFVLDVSAPESHLSSRVESRRPFVLSTPNATARIVADAGTWDLAVTGERTFAAGDPMSANLTALLDSNAELRWLRTSGATIQVVEHALEAGAVCHVVGFARHARPVEVAEAALLARTGTDDIAMPVASTTIAAATPDLWIGPGEAHDFLLIASAAPRLASVAPSPLVAAGAALGPLLSLGGLLYLAHAAELTIAGRF